MKKVLIIAYYSPPLGMGGTQRLAKFVKYLPQFGWSPTVVTVKDIIYFARDETLLKDMRGAEVVRTGSLDPQRLLALLTAHKSTSTVSQAERHKKWRGLNKLVSTLFIPDAKVLWLPFAFLRALRLLRQEKIDCLMTTAPPHSAHLTGLMLKRITDVPWIADFRDGWAGGNFQNEPTSLHRAVNRFWQRRVLRSADAVITVSAHLTQTLLRQGGTNDGKFRTITNGFDPDDLPALNGETGNAKFTIAYCGTISEVAPMDSFLDGFSRLLLDRPDLRDKILINFIGQDLSGDLKKQLSRLSLKDVVKLSGYLSHQEALEKLFTADLLLYPVSKWVSHDFIPGKTFEYLATGKPVLVIGPQVAGVEFLKAASHVEVVGHDSSAEISGALLKLFEMNKVKETVAGQHNHFDRKTLTEELSRILDQLAVT